MIKTMLSSWLMLFVSLLGNAVGAVPPDQSKAWRVQQQITFQSFLHEHQQQRHQKQQQEEDRLLQTTEIDIATRHVDSSPLELCLFGSYFEPAAALHHTVWDTVTNYLRQEMQPLLPADLHPSVSARIHILPGMETNLAAISSNRTDNDHYVLCYELVAGVNLEASPDNAAQMESMQSFSESFVAFTVREAMKEERLVNLKTVLRVYGLDLTHITVQVMPDPNDPTVGVGGESEAYRDSFTESQAGEKEPPEEESVFEDLGPIELVSENLPSVTASNDASAYDAAESLPDVFFLPPLAGMNETDLDDEYEEEIDPSPRHAHGRSKSAPHYPKKKDYDVPKDKYYSSPYNSTSYDDHEVEDEDDPYHDCVEDDYYYYWEYEEEVSDDEYSAEEEYPEDEEEHYSEYEEEEEIPSIYYGKGKGKGKGQAEKSSSKSTSKSSSKGSSKTSKSSKGSSKIRGNGKGKGKGKGKVYEYKGQSKSYESEKKRKKCHRPSYGYEHHNRSPKLQRPGGDDGKSSNGSSKGRYPHATAHPSPYYSYVPVVSPGSDPPAASATTAPIAAPTPPTPTEPLPPAFEPLPNETPPQGGDESLAPVVPPTPVTAGEDPMRPAFEPIFEAPTEIPAVVVDTTSTPDDNNVTAAPVQSPGPMAATAEGESTTAASTAGPSIATTTSSPTVAFEAAEVGVDVMDATTEVAEGIKGDSDVEDVFEPEEVVVPSDTQILEVTGIFDPRGSETIFFNDMESIMEPFFESNLNDALQSFALTVKFLHDYTTLDSNGSGGARTTLVKAYCTIDVHFTVLTTSSDFLTRDQASDLVGQFFSGRHGFYLKRKLNDNGVRINDIKIIDELPAKPSPGEITDGDLTSVYDGAEGTNSKSTEKNNSTALFSALFSGMIVAVAVGAVVFLKHRRARRNLQEVGANPIFDAWSACSSGSSSDDSSSQLPNHGNKKSNMKITSLVKPAALQVRNRKEATAAAAATNASPDIRSESGDDNNSHDDDGDDDSSKKSIGSELRNLFSRNKPPRMEELVASSALTCLDPDLDDSLATKYPEFQVYSHVPKPLSAQRSGRRLNPSYPVSPIWSVSSKSYTSAAEDEDYAAERRRWHEQVNDMALVSLPDHSSEQGYASEHTGTQSHSEHDLYFDHP